MAINRFEIAALFAMTASVFAVSLTTGCSRQEEVYTANDMAYARDPAYQADLKKQRDAQKEIFARRAALDARMKKLVERCGGKREMAEALPEWAELVAAQKKCDDDLKANRRQSAAIIQARVQKAMADQARVDRGEAKAKTISQQEVKQ